MLVNFTVSRLNQKSLRSLWYYMSNRHQNVFINTFYTSFHSYGKLKKLCVISSSHAHFLSLGIIITKRDQSRKWQTDLILVVGNHKFSDIFYLCKWSKPVIKTAEIWCFTPTSLIPPFTYILKIFDFTCTEWTI